MKRGLEQILEDITGIIVGRLNPRKIILFGSRARKTNRKFSDIDLCIEGARTDEHRVIRKLREEIEDAAGLYSVDIVFCEDLDNDFLKMVYSTGKVIYEEE